MRVLGIFLPREINPAAVVTSGGNAEVGVYFGGFIQKRSNEQDNEADQGA